MAMLSDTARIRIASAAAITSVLVATHLVLSLLCSGWPLIFYAVAGGMGALCGPWLHGRSSGDGWGSKLVRRSGAGLAVFSAIGLELLIAMPVNWQSKCAWRHCGRALGPSLWQSPFPVGTPTCGGWHTCANEYPYSPTEYRRVFAIIEREGCPAP